MLWAGIIGLGFFGEIAPDPLIEGPGVEVATRTYDVFGLTPFDIRVDMNRARQAAGLPFDARTEWRVFWRFSLSSGWRGARRRCSVSGGSVRVEINYILPNWVDGDRAAPAVRGHWERYFTALIEHEDGHAEFGIAAAEDIRTMIERFPSMARCGQLREAINAGALEIIDNYAAEDDAYDKRTRNGTLTGAVFPQRSEE